jgi:hypothetical protein
MGRHAGNGQEAINDMNMIGPSGVGPATYAQPATRRTPPPMTGTAQLLDISTDQLTSDLQSGESLNSLASQKGISSSTLLSTVQSDLKANAPAGSIVSGSQLQEMASNLVQGRGRHQHKQGGGPDAVSPLVGEDDGSTPPDPTMSSASTDATTSSSALGSMATLLGLSSTQLTDALESGTTLSTLAIQQGVSSADVISSVASDLKANAPQGAPALSGDQVQQMAADVVNGTEVAAPSRPTGVGSSGGAGSSGRISSLGASSSTTATNNLHALASATGLDPGLLLSRLQSGQDLSSLLASAGQTGYGSSVGSSVNGGVLYDDYA